MFAFFQSDGSKPVDSAFVKMTCKIGEISTANCLRMNDGILSGPLTLFVSRLDNN